MCCDPMVMYSSNSIHPGQGPFFLCPVVDVHLLLACTLGTCAVLLAHKPRNTPLASNLAAT
eukprot:COSAG02_NODE_802_length_17030_cov_37.485500_21_plen_61_part_00